jgi:PAS domain-containing protein
MRSRSTIIVLHEAGRRLYANRAALEYHVHTLDEFLVVNHSECFHHDDLRAYERLREAAIASGKGWEAEIRLGGKMDRSLVSDALDHSGMNSPAPSVGIFQGRTLRTARLPNAHCSGNRIAWA